MAELAYSIDEAAEKMGISGATVRRLVAQGKLPVYRTGDKKSRILIPHDALVKHLTDTALAAVKTEVPEEQPIPALQLINHHRKHWSDIPGCGGRKRKANSV